MTNRGGLAVICDFNRYLRYVFQFTIVLILLSLFSLFLVEPGSESFYMVVINLSILSGLLVLSMGLVVICRRKRGRKTVDAVVDETVDD